MRIAGSTINMASERLYTSKSQLTMTRETVLLGAQTTQKPSFTDTLKAAEDAGEEENLFTNYNSTGDFAIQDDNKTQSRISEIENIRMQLMEKILNIMQILYGGSTGTRKSKLQNFMNELHSNMNAGSYQWMSVSPTPYVHIEEEHSAFTAQGIARTEDGREIGFNVNLSMSRKFTEEIGAMHMQPANLIDPLVINVGNEVTEISDQTFTFDLDADGKTEEIKSLGKGSGFIAYDKNGDGVINDGTELFGAISGDGFSELAKYDSDKDGWIDEDDEIFDKLKVWCHGEDGKDTLMTLKEADVGAICLQNSETNFTVQGSDFGINGKFRASSIFLRESTGNVGMVHQIDLAKVSARLIKEMEPYDEEMPEDLPIYDKLTYL